MEAGSGLGFLLELAPGPKPGEAELVCCCSQDALLLSPKAGRSGDLLNIYLTLPRLTTLTTHSGFEGHKAFHCKTRDPGGKNLCASGCCVLGDGPGFPGPQPRPLLVWLHWLHPQKTRAAGEATTFALGPVRAPLVRTCVARPSPAVPGTLPTQLPKPALPAPGLPSAHQAAPPTMNHPPSLTL